MRGRFLASPVTILLQSTVYSCSPDKSENRQKRGKNTTWSPNLYLQYCTVFCCQSSYFIIEQSVQNSNSERSELRVAALTPVFVTRYIGVYIIDFQREVCKPFLKLDFTSHGIIESLSASKEEHGCMGPYAGVDYNNLTLCPLHSQLQHKYNGHWTTL